jgi:hypothetical protein
VYCYIFLPETRGKTLREIELEFSPKEMCNNEESAKTRYTMKSELSGCNKNEFIHVENGRTPEDRDIPHIFTVETRYAKFKREGNGSAT